MTLQELITDLKAAGANENTIRLAMNCYELGKGEGVDAEWVSRRTKFAVEQEREACASIVENAWTAFSRAPIFRLEVNPFPELKFAAKRIRERGNA